MICNLFNLITYNNYNQLTTDKMMKFTTIANAKKQTGLSYLGGVSTSAKIMHSQKYSHQYTYAIYLAPAKTSGYQVCSHSTPECRMGCLSTSGRTAVEIFSGRNTIQKARIKKTRLFYEDPNFFIQWMIAEINMYQKKAIKDNFYFSVRLNATSDIDWENVKINGQTIFEIFPEVNFYDYTKNYLKFNNKASNYHLTYSYTGRNWTLCKVLLKQGFNVAMVFNVKKETLLPAMYNGYNVINGDLTDYRIDDAKGIIIGLKFKRIANRINEAKVLNSCFVVNPASLECTYTNVRVENMELVLV
jgi:hypothetical protein